MKLKSISLFLAGSLALFVSANLAAYSGGCESINYTSDKIDIIDHAEPDLPPVLLPEEQKKAAKSSTSFFSWLTKSHTMPSLHFIEFIELFGNDKP